MLPTKAARNPDPRVPRAPSPGQGWLRGGKGRGGPDEDAPGGRGRKHTRGRGWPGSRSPRPVTPDWDGSPWDSASLLIVSSDSAPSSSLRRTLPGAPAAFSRFRSGPWPKLKQPLLCPLRYRISLGNVVPPPARKAGTGRRRTTTPRRLCAGGAR